MTLCTRWQRIGHSLPAGLDVLCFSATLRLKPNVLPSSLSLLDLRSYQGTLDVGVVPPTPSWLVLLYGIVVAEDAVPATTRVVTVRMAVIDPDTPPPHRLTNWRRDRHGDLTSEMRD